MGTVRQKRMRDVVGLHQHWRHVRTRQAIYITQVFRSERRVLAIKWNPVVGFPGCEGKAKQEYISFAELKKNYTLMGPYPTMEAA